MRKTPSACKTFIDLLELRAISSPDKTAFIIDEKKFSYSWLWEHVNRFALQLFSKGIKPKDRVLILVPNSAEFFIAFYGCILSGAIAVPVFPNAGTDRCRQLFNLSGSSNIILPENMDTRKQAAYIEFSKTNQVCIHWVSTNISPVTPVDFPAIHGDDIAFIQYTSGSTDFPKGVPLTHHNLLTNIKQMVEAMNITNKDVFVSWLPVYHDMGLILNTMAPFYTGAGLVLLAEGLHKVPSWLKAIQKHKGSFISAPDFAYRLCVKSIRDHANYDLSSLRVALNASEPVHLLTFRLFEEAFNLKNVMIAGYGLAEATVAVTMHPPGTAPKTDAKGYVSSGKPLKNIQIKIVSKGVEKNTGETGEILVKSPAVMKGYYNNKRKKNSFDKQGFLHTGDIGYLDKQDFLYVLSRKKNIIIQGGRTIYPDDVEQVVRSLKEVRHAAAIGVEKPPASGEKLYVFAEAWWIKCPSGPGCHELAVEIVQQIYDHLGIKPAKVYILKPKSLLVTPNGKLQHSRLKFVFLKDSQFVRHTILYPKTN